MEYTIQKLAALAEISTRTLRYYDSFGLLKPLRKNSSGYRLYGKEEVDRLQMILFFRELGVSLQTIREIMLSDSFDRDTILREHREQLLLKKEKLDRLIANVENTLDRKKRGMQMTDKEKFEGFSQKMLEENETKYGAEIRGKYGDEAVDLSYQKWKGLTEANYKQMEEISEKLHEMLKAAFDLGDPASDLAQETCDLHKRWLMFYWTTYSKQTHMALVQNYVDDERFTAYYDKIALGCAVFLRDAMRIYTSA